MKTEPGDLGELGELFRWKAGPSQGVEGLTTSTDDGRAGEVGRVGTGAAPLGEDRAFGAPTCEGLKRGRAGAAYPNPWSIRAARRNPGRRR